MCVGVCLHVCRCVLLGTCTCIKYIFYSHDRDDLITGLASEKVCTNILGSTYLMVAMASLRSARSVW